MNKNLQIKENKYVKVSSLMLLSASAILLSQANVKAQEEVMSAEETEINVVEIENTEEDLLDVREGDITPEEEAELVLFNENNPNYHYVVPGDTLWSIAQRYGATVEQLMLWNNLTSYALDIGALLIVNIEPEEPEPDEEIVHTVATNDTLYSIAIEYSVTMQEIRDWNNLSSDQLNIGDQLVIYLGEEEPEKPEEPEEPEPGESIIHTVSAGDTLYGIASQYGTTVQAIKSWNNLTSDFLQIDEQLIIYIEETEPEEPDPEPERPITYVVQAGDYLYLIATRYNVTVQQLRDWNNLTSDILYVGDILYIENPGATPPDEELEDGLIRDGRRFRTLSAALDYAYATFNPDYHSQFYVNWAGNQEYTVDWSLK